MLSKQMRHFSIDKTIKKNVGLCS